MVNEVGHESTLPCKMGSKFYQVVYMFNTTISTNKIELFMLLKPAKKNCYVPVNHPFHATTNLCKILTLMSGAGGFLRLLPQSLEMCNVTAKGLE